MPIVTIKQSIGFPEIGQVRKGNPKTDKGYVGQDLKTKLRVVFYPGEDNQKSQAAFIHAHGGLIVDRINFTFPFQNPFECFDCWYEAYSAGRMIARADGERFIRLIGEDGQVQVSGGEPYTPFDPSEPVYYTNRRTGQREAARMKATGRLKILIPELNRVAYLTVMTTSIYDIARLNQQLGALQTLSGFLPSGRGVSGMPLVLSRQMVNVTWVQDDGSAKRVPHGLLTIEADPAWVEQMMNRMSKFALPDTSRTQISDALLSSGDEVRLEIPQENQQQAHEEAESGDPDETSESVVPDILCPQCGQVEPDHLDTCPILKQAIQEYYDLAYRQLSWSKEDALAVVKDCGGNFVKALEKARNQVPQGRLI